MRNMIDLEKFMSNIKLNDNVIEHLKETTLELEKYLNRLSKYNNDSIDMFLYDLLVKETTHSSKLERELFSPQVIEVYELLFANNNKITEDMLFKMHEAVMYHNTIEHRKGGQYREHVVWIGNPNEGIEYAHHIPPEYTEIPKYMDDFINYFNNNKELNSPIIKGAIIHVLLIKIHPYADGNGRMARILQSHKTKTLINEQYGLKLKYPPLNISKNYDMTRLAYFKKQNDIKFNLELDNNIAFNQWFEYILTMCDEQLFYINSRLDKYDKLLSEGFLRGGKRF